MKDMKKWLWESAKVVYRYAVIALFPIFLDIAIRYVQELLTGVSNLALGENEKWLIRFALAGADKFLHDWKKSTGSEGKWKGLVGA